MAPDQEEAPETVQDTRWLNGVNRQLRSDAPSQRQAASAAAAVKRKAGAMTEDERKAKDAERNKRNRAAKQAELSDFHAALARVTAEAALGEDEQVDFSEWLWQHDLAPDQASLDEWRGSDSYELTKRERIAEGCTCFLEPDGGKRVNALPFNELKRRVDDGMLQAGDSFQAWDERVLADRNARGVSIGDYFERPWEFSWCGSFRQCTCTYDGHGDEARIVPDVPGQNCDHYDEREARRLLEPRADDWQPSGGDWVPDGWDDTGDAVTDAAPSPSPTPPPLPPPSVAADSGEPDDSDAYELDQERALEEQGRISAIHRQPWYQVLSGATVPMHWLDYVKRQFEELASSFRRRLVQRPHSPAPEAADFETEDEFLQERARWFRENGNGSELQGETRREQNNRFQRLKDRLFGLRRERANPSGTPTSSWRAARQQ